MISRNLSNQRDIGLMTKGETKFFDYKAGIFNGQGYNSDDTINSQIDYAFWGIIKPFAFNENLGKLYLGGGFYDGKQGTGSRSSTYDNYNNNVISYYGEYKWPDENIYSS